MKVLHAPVRRKGRLAADLELLSLELPQEVLSEAVPGQCAHLKVPHDDARILRRPISIYSMKDGLLHLAIQPKGEGTHRLLEAREGEEIDIIFPFGKGFLPKAYQNIWLVGGGVGVAPLHACVEGFADGRQTRAYLGFRTSAHIYAVEECEAHGCHVSVCTDDGSAGEHGLVTAPLLRDLAEGKPDVIMACGPTPMLRAVQAIAKEHGVPAQLSLEARMGCGIGACLTCTCATSFGGALRVCTDGPVFDGEVVSL